MTAFTRAEIVPLTNYRHRCENTTRRSRRKHFRRGIISSLVTKYLSPRNLFTNRFSYRGNMWYQDFWIRNIFWKVWWSWSLFLLTITIYYLGKKQTEWKSNNEDSRIYSNNAKKTSKKTRKWKNIYTYVTSLMMCNM